MKQSTEQPVGNDGPDLVGEIRAGVAAACGDQVQRAAHRLKGLFAGYGCQHASRLAEQLEHNAAEERLETATELGDEIEVEVQTLCEGIKGYLAE